MRRHLGLHDLKNWPNYFVFQMKRLKYIHMQRSFSNGYHSIKNIIMNKPQIVQEDT